MKLLITFYHASIREEAKSCLLRDDISCLDRAYNFLIVNRSSFNGVGGFSTTMLARRNMSKSVSDFLSMIDKLPEIHNRLSQVLIENRDFMDLIKKYDSPETFFYFDPPYVASTRSSSTKYEEEMSDSDHINFIELVNSCQAKVMISGYNHEIYNKLSDRFHKIEFNSPNTNTDRIECLWKNYL